jgi:hypothetical protein
MVKKKIIAILFIPFLVIGLIHGLMSSSFNNFFTWILIGLWISVVLKIIENVKKHREFNSPHNTAFFVIIPLFMGIFYSIWGYYTGILGENLLVGSNFYFSSWSLIFGFPFVLFGSYSLYRCFKKYNVIYFGTKPVKAKTLGFILAFTILAFIITYWIIFYTAVINFDSILIPLRFSLNLNLLIIFISTILIIIVFGFLSSRRTLPALTNDYIEQRTRRVNSLTTATPSSLSRTQRQRVTTRNSTQTPSRRIEIRTSRIQTSRSTPVSQKKTRRIKATNKTNASKVTQNRGKKVRNLNAYKPIASTLSQDDFKCIFCFKLPKLPDDKGRGIILCPHCKYPAHADEFKDWVRTSNLCSRCSSLLPSNFRNNPKIISVKNYMIIYRHFLNKKNNK